MPRRALDVRAAMASPPGTETVSATGRSVTSPTAARIMRAGTGLMAGAPTGRPRPGRVTVPTPGAGVQLDGAGGAVGREPGRRSR